MIFDRPRFANPSEYVASVREAFRQHLEPWEPRTGSELRAVLAAFGSEAHRWRPAADQVDTLGEMLERVRRKIDREPEPWPQNFRERFLATLQEDQKFRRAVGLVARGAR